MENDFQAVSGGSGKLLNDSWGKTGVRSFAQAFVSRGRETLTSTGDIVTKPSVHEAVLEDSGTV